MMMSTYQGTDEDYASAVAELEALLRLTYDQFTHIDDPTKLDLARSILSRIGTIDAEVEGLASKENQRDLSIKFHWGHNHRFNDDLTVKGRMGDRHLNLMAQFMVRYDKGKDHFAGKRVIDVGCWTGGTSLLLKALGAGDILALEEVQKYATAARDLVQGVYDLDDVTCNGTNLYDLETDNPYDIAYFPGVIYHLSDPVLSLRRLFNSVKDGGEIFVESMGLDSGQPVARYDGNRLFHDASKDDAKNLNRGGWNWFVPSPPCLARWMEEAGFEDVDCFYSKISNRVFGYGVRKRFQEITRAGLSVRDIA